MLKNLKALLDRNINYPAAFIGAAILGGIVFSINYSHGVPLALVAASKQATYTFFAGGFITRLVERLSIKYPNPVVSIATGACTGVIIAVGLTLLVHSMKGTPEPLYSTLPTLVLAIPGFSALGYRARQKHFAEYGATP